MCGSSRHCYESQSASCKAICNYAYALPGSAARQLFISSTLLDSSTATRQTSTELDAQAHGVRLDRLDRNSTVTRQARQARPRQRLDSTSTVPRRSLDSSTARQPGLKAERARAARMCALGAASRVVELEASKRPVGVGSAVGGRRAGTKRVNPIASCHTHHTRSRMTPHRPHRSECIAQCRSHVGSM